MKMKEVMNAATMGNPRKLIPMILWTMAEYACRGAPHGLVLFFIYELFVPLENPGTPLNYVNLAIIIVAFVGVTVALHLVSKKAYLEMYFKTYDISAEGRMHIANHLKSMSMGFFNARDPGKIGAYLINDYANIEFYFTHLFPQMFGVIIMPMTVVLFLFVQSWQLAIVSFLVIPIGLPFTKLTQWLVNKLGVKQKKAKVDAQSRMLEYVQGMKDIKAFNLSGTRFERMKQTFNKLKKAAIKLEAGAGPSVLASNFIINSGFTMLLLFGITFMLSGTVSLPVYLSFVILGGRVFDPVIQGMVLAIESRYYHIAVKRIQNLINTRSMCGNEQGLEPGNLNIEFKNVSFKYDKIKVLEEITTSIPEKSLVALVGPSGSGKTTMTRLIARFWDVEGGSITLGGRDIRDYDPDTLLGKISMVFQDVYLFNDTILNNIKIGRKDATMEDVIEAAKVARIHDFITNLPDGYETIVGEGGSTLSGGEKQRVSIARAILKDSPIVLLDEATASLDPENELYIQQAIDGLVSNKTVVIIAHRLNTVVNADKIVVLDEGRIAEEGTHQELLESRGLYANLWKEQNTMRSWKFARTAA